MNSPHISIFNHFPFPDLYCRRMSFEIPQDVKPEAMDLEKKMSRESDRNIRRNWIDGSSISVEIITKTSSYQYYY